MNSPETPLLEGPRPTPLIYENEVLSMKKRPNPRPPTPGKQRPTIHCSVEPSNFRSFVLHVTSRDSLASDKSKICRKQRAYEDMLGCLTTIKTENDSFYNVSKNCLDCVVYCTLFPVGCVIDKDTLIQLWMAEGLVTDEPMEDIAVTYLNVLSENGAFFTFLREDLSSGKKWYKVIQFTLSHKVLEFSRISPVTLLSDDPKSVIHTVKKYHYHVTLQNLPRNGLNDLSRFTDIKTILLLKDHKCRIEHLPYDFFIKLPNLHTLNLSRTKLSELPSSIGSAVNLRFLDLSETLIKRLPETMDCLQKLQTLKLQNCPCLVTLPKAITWLTMLRHLDLGTLCRLRGMPSEIGTLTGLRTLSEFIVGQQCEYGSIKELKYMNHLGGKICLSRLENVTSVHDAKQAKLWFKQKINKLELRWTDNSDPQTTTICDQVIEHLYPNLLLQDLRIICYKGSSFPSWISHPPFKLVSLTLFKCENCEFLPALGQLRSLVSLSLIELTGVRIIDSRFCKDDVNDLVDDRFIPFQMLEKLEIKSMSSLKEWRDMARSSFPSLVKLVIKECPELVSICKLSKLAALEYLELSRCTKFVFRKDEYVHASLKMLVVEDCPEFSYTMSNNVPNWREIQHSPNLVIYERQEEETDKDHSDPLSTVNTDHNDSPIAPPSTP